MSFLLTLALAGLSPMLLQESSAQPISVPSAVAPAALELAQILNSEALTRTQIDKMLDETFPASLAKNPEMAALEKTYPGAINAVLLAIKPVLTDYMIGELPQMWREIAPIYAQSFTVAELHQLLAFYKGPVGVRLIATMGRGMDFGSTIDRAIETKDSLVTGADLKAATSSGIAAVIRSASDEDRAAMAALAKTSAGAKLPEVGRRVQERIVVISNRGAPAVEAQMEKTTIDALEAHIAKSAKP